MAGEGHRQEPGGQEGSCHRGDGQGQLRTTEPTRRREDLLDSAKSETVAQRLYLEAWHARGAGASEASGPRWKLQ